MVNTVNTLVTPVDSAGKIEQRQRAAKVPAGRCEHAGTVFGAIALYMLKGLRHGEEHHA